MKTEREIRFTIMRIICLEEIRKELLDKLSPIIPEGGNNEKRRD